MTSLPYSQPRTAGGRPPVDPPVHTTFDSSSGDDRDPLYKVFADSVRHLITAIRSATQTELQNADKLAFFLTLIEMRKSAIEKELRAERMFTTDELPPRILDMLPLDELFEEDEAIRSYKVLLEILDGMQESILGMMRDLNDEGLASDL